MKKEEVKEIVNLLDATISYAFDCEVLSLHYDFEAVEDEDIQELLFELEHEAEDFNKRVQYLKDQLKEKYKIK